MLTLICQKKIKYYVYGVSLYFYCKWIQINYNDVTRSIRYYNSKHENNNLDKVISHVISIYLVLKKRKLKRRALLNVIENHINMEDVSKILNIRISSVWKITKYGLSKRNAILILYFLYDYFKEKKSITKKHLLNILDSINKKNFKDEWHYLVCFYYMGVDVTHDICRKLEKMITICIYKEIFNIDSKNIQTIINDKEDIIQDLQIKGFDLLKNHKILMDNANQIQAYLFKTFYFIIKQKIKEFKKEPEIRHLEDYVYEGKELLEFIPSFPEDNMFF